MLIACTANKEGVVRDVCRNHHFLEKMTGSYQFVEFFKVSASTDRPAWMRMTFSSVILGLFNPYRHAPFASARRLLSMVRRCSQEWMGIKDLTNQALHRRPKRQ